MSSIVNVPSPSVTSEIPLYAHTGLHADFWSNGLFLANRLTPVCVCYSPAGQPSVVATPDPSGTLGPATIIVSTATPCQGVAFSEYVDISRNTRSRRPKYGGPDSLFKTGEYQ